MIEEILDKAFSILKNNNDLELAEIVKSSATGTPRKSGAFMFVDKDLKSFGTIGGGTVEYLATKYAADLLKNKENGEKEFNLSQKETENIGMVCGGDITVKFTYLTNDDNSKNVIDKLREQNNNKFTVYIFGAGHVSIELTKILHYVEFSSVVWDDRSDFANEERFIFSKRIICKPFTKVLDEIKVSNRDFVVIMTRGHVFDYEVAKQILETNAYYIGIIGSSNKIKVLKEKLWEDGFSSEKVNSICMPIGIPIAAETPEEIAISIASELMLFRSRLENRTKVMNNNKLVDLYLGKGLKI